MERNSHLIHLMDENHYQRQQEQQQQQIQNACSKDHTNGNKNNQIQYGNHHNKVQTLVMEYQWGNHLRLGSTTQKGDPNTSSSSSILDDMKFDFIFGTDIAYRHYLHEALIESLIAKSHPNTIILIGITMMDTDVIFFQRLAQAGFTYERLDDHLMDPEFRGYTFGLFVIHRHRRRMNYVFHHL